MERVLRQRGGRRPRHIPPGLAVYVATGRWGRKRALVEQCAAVLAAELVYGMFLRDGAPVAPGWRVVGSWAPHGLDGPSWEVTAEVLPVRFGAVDDCSSGVPSAAGF